jgi:hypothetical protein
MCHLEPIDQIKTTSVNEATGIANSNSQIPDLSISANN